MRSCTAVLFGVCLILAGMSRAATLDANPGIYLDGTAGAGPDSSGLLTSEFYHSPHGYAFSDQHSFSISGGTAAVTGSLSGQPGLLQAQVTTSGAFPTSSSASLTCQFSDNLTLVTTALPTGTPEEFELTATLNYTATASGGANPAFATEGAVLPVAFAGVLAPVGDTELPALPIFPATADVPPGTYSQMLTFDAGQTFVLDVQLNLFAASGTLDTNENVNASLTYSIVPLTPEATFTSAVTEANLPEPSAALLTVTLCGIAVLRRRGKASAFG